MDLKGFISDAYNDDTKVPPIDNDESSASRNVDWTKQEESRAKRK